MVRAKKDAGDGGEAAKPKESVDELLAKLAASDDQAEKRRIRARLRTLGHKGGLGKREKKEGGAKPKAKAKAKAKPKAKAKARAKKKAS